MSGYTRYNSKMWDAWSEQRNQWTIPLSHEEFLKAKAEPPLIFLTPEKTVPLAWFPPAGARVLGVACGGGQQGPVLVASGYEVSIMDLSDRQLGAERLVAAREGYRIDTVKADMTVNFPFASASFDLVVNPVSNSYIEELDNLWRESFRVLKPGGALMTGWANPLLYLFEDAPFEQEGLDFVCKFPLPYNGRKMAEAGMEVRLDTGFQFSHTLEAQIGGQLRAGFVLKGFYEDTESASPLARFTSMYAADLAVKPA